MASKPLFLRAPAALIQKLKDQAKAEHLRSANEMAVVILHRFFSGKDGVQKP